MDEIAFSTAVPHSGKCRTQLVCPYEQIARLRRADVGRGARRVGRRLRGPFRSENLLFTATAREDLDEIASWQRLSDLAFAGQCRAIVAAHNRASLNDRQFVPDEVALAINASPTTATSLMIVALEPAALPGLRESVESGALTERHVRAVLRELDTVDLDPEQRAAVVMVLLARFNLHTPGELVKLVRRLVLTVDLPAARRRAEKAAQSRGVWCRPDMDGQGVLSARGPLAAIAAVKACLDTMRRDSLTPATSGATTPGCSTCSSTC